MLDLVPILDVNEVILQNQQNADSSSLHIVGQEQDGTIIYAIDGPKKGSNVPNEEFVTYIGILDPQYPSTTSIILTHDKKVNIVNASIDRDRIFVGFVTVEQTRITGVHGKRQQQDVYKAFLAEIKPQNRTFYLNLERESYLKLQFLYGTAKTPLSSSREAHMLVFLHKESIGLYHLQVESKGEKNATNTLSSEPRKEQIVHKKFVWSQWDASTQLLFVVYSRKRGRDSQGQTTYSPILVCYQFSASATAALMFEYVLDVPLSHSKTLTRCQYLEEGPFHSTPDMSINMRVLTLNNGGINVCFQTMASEADKKDSAAVVIQYSVLMLHHGKSLVCRCAHLPLSVAQKARLHFNCIGDYILVYLPGYFTHLLNVGVEFEPSHHICWHDPSWPLKFPDKCVLHNDHHIVPGILVPYICTSAKIGDKKCANVYEPSTGVAYSLSVSDQAICDILTCSVELSVRLSLFHYAILHARDLVLTQRLFRIVCDDTTNPDLPNILQEILIALTFAQTRRVVDVHILHCLPFTCVQTFRGQVVHAANRVRLFSISYSNPSLSSFCDKRDPDSPSQRFWDNLVYNVKNCGSLARFRCQSVKQEMDQIFLLKNHKLDKDQNISLFRRLEAAAKSVFSNHGNTKPKEVVVKKEGVTPVSVPLSASSSRAHSKAEQMLGSIPPFLSRSGEEHQISGSLALVLQKTMEMLSNHLVKQTKKESRSRIKHAAEEFVRNQILQCRTLCHLIWSILGSEEIEFVPLNVPVSGQELVLFSLFERFHVATEVLAFPQPPGFKFYFATLSFRCLDLRDFIQYIDRGVIHMSIELATQMLEDLDDSPLNVEAKLQIISRLSRVEAIDCLQHWDHPISLKFLGSKYTTTCITDDSSVGWEIFPTPPHLLTGDTRSTTSSEQRSLSANVFPPVKTLIRLLEEQDPGLAVGECMGNLHLDSRFIEEAAMLYTNAESRSECTDV